jgi:hypothetical protein
MAAPVGRRALLIVAEHGVDEDPDPNSPIAPLTLPMFKPAGPRQATHKSVMSPLRLPFAAPQISDVPFAAPFAALPFAAPFAAQ